MKRKEVSTESKEVDASTVVTKHGTLYKMDGFMKKNHWFQDVVHHEVRKTKKDVGERISITCRLSAVHAAKINFSPVKTCTASVGLVNEFYDNKEVQKLLNYDEIKKELDPLMTPDITKMYGKVCTNSGRMSAELMASNWDKPETFRYKYGKAQHTGQAMPPCIAAILQYVKLFAAHELDWTHITYYPTGNTGIGAHGDNEPEVAYGSDILCVSLMKNMNSARTIHFSLKKQ